MMPCYHQLKASLVNADDALVIPAEKTPLSQANHRLKQVTVFQCAVEPLNNTSNQSAVPTKM